MLLVPNANKPVIVRIHTGTTRIYCLLPDQACLLTGESIRTLHNFISSPSTACQCTRWQWGVGGGGQKGHVLAGVPRSDRELRPFPACGRSGALCVGHPWSCQALRCPGQDHCSPRRKGLGLGDEPPHGSAQGYGAAPARLGLSQRRYRWLSGSRGRGKGGAGSLPFGGSWQWASSAAAPAASGVCTLCPFCVLLEGW